MWVKRLYWFLLCGGILWSASVSAEVVWGRERWDQTFSVQAQMGSVIKLEGSVHETTRPYYNITNPEENEGREDYDLDELGFTDSYLVGGLGVEKQWKYITLRFDASYLNPSADGIADRDYYIGVSEVEYEGKEYEYMMIPEGDAYKIDLQGGLLNLKTMITPVSLRAGDGLQFVPWLHLGFFGLLGYYDIDAGPARGIKEYEYPPVEYVIGGQASGWTGLVVPELGLGGELSVRLARNTHGDVRLLVQGDVGLFKFDGKLSNIGISARHDKDIDLDYLNWDARVLVEFPLNDSLLLFAGVEYRYIDADADVTAVEATEDEIEERREKFDKKVKFKMSTGLAFVGIRF
jgi:hypothetical protein